MTTVPLTVPKVQFFVNNSIFQNNVWKVLKNYPTFEEV